MTLPTPIVSVVMATYNRSNILCFAIQSVLAQTFDAWELIVVGDACTDETESVVRAFADPRIRFVNLKHNIGEQSGPNNHGASLARASLIAFLNHDDYWLPNHLACLVSRQRETQADLIIAYAVTSFGDGTMRLLGHTNSGRYETGEGFPASTWLLRATLHKKLDGWQPARRIWAAPSQDFLQRAARAGAKVAFSPRVSVLMIPSGGRKNAYRDRHADEHVWFVERIVHENSFLEDALTRACEFEHTRGTSLSPRVLVKRVIRNWVYGVCGALGWSRSAIFGLLVGRKKGGYLDHLRRIRGLGPLK